MDPTQTEELKNLLRDSLFHIAVRTSRNESMTLDNYRAYLLAARSLYSPELRLQVSLYKPDVEDQFLKENLLSLIETELAPFIQEGRIHSATAPLFGGAGSGANIEIMLTNLLIRTVVDGPEVAAAAFAECAENTSCTFYDFELLAGARVNEEIEIFDGIRTDSHAEQARGTPSLPASCNRRSTRGTQARRLSVEGSTPGGDECHSSPSQALGEKRLRLGTGRTLPGWLHRAMKLQTSNRTYSVRPCL